jgi:hypothetical protein
MKSTYTKVYSIYRTKLGVNGDWFLCFIIFNMFLDVRNSTVLYFYFTCMRGDTEKNRKNFSIEPISANSRMVCWSVVYRRCIARTLV